MFVGAGEGAATVESCGQIDLLVVAYCRPVTERHAVHAQTRYAAIRENVEAQVAEGLVIVDFVVVMAVALQLDGRQYFHPLGVFIRFARGQEAGFQRGRWWKVAGEE